VLLGSTTQVKYFLLIGEAEQAIMRLMYPSTAAIPTQRYTADAGASVAGGYTYEAAGDGGHGRELLGESS
jgi:hypothetical protein